MGPWKKSRSKKRTQLQSSNGGFSDDFRNFKTLFPVIQSPEGMKPRVLRNLYRHLAHLSLNAQWSVKYSQGSSHDFDLEICHDGIKVTFTDISELSNILFKELDERFEQLFSNLCGNLEIGESISSFVFFDHVELLSLLFRCCLMLLTLLVAKQNTVLEYGLVLLRIIRKLSSPDVVENSGERAFAFERSIFSECDNGCSASSVEGFTVSLEFSRPSNPLLSFMSTMLEIFVDELLANRLLRGYFKMINSFASTNGTLFSPHSAPDDIGIVIEVLCNHFILSFSNKKAFGDFPSQLFCTHAMELNYPLRALGLSVNSSVSLLLRPIMVTIPKYMQAHLISIFSEALYYTKSSKPDRKLANCCLTTFEKSVHLYMTHMSCFEKDVVPTCKSSLSRGNESPPFEFYISPKTKHKIDSLITKLDNSSNVNSDDISFRLKSDMVSSCMRFLKECLNVYAISYQDDILAILSCLVLKASESYDDKKIRPVEGTTRQHLYLLCSILKLMGTSLLQVISCLRHNVNDSCRPKTLKDFASCKEYDFVLDIIKCFEDLDISRHLQQDLDKLISSLCVRRVRPKMMFLHFLGLMSLSFGSGLECLVKGCLLVILAVLSMFVFEEGDLEAFRLLINSDEKQFSSGLSVVRLQETVVNQKSSLVVASKFHKIRSQHSSSTQNKDNENGSQSLQTSEDAISSHLLEEEEEEEEEETEETSNGEIFFKCMLKIGDNNISSADDLVDFVECKHGKDYSVWLQNRQKYRKWKLEKLAVLRWKRKKKTWKTLKGKKN